MSTLGKLIHGLGWIKFRDVGAVYSASVINAASAFLVIGILSRTVDAALLSKVNFYLIAISFGLAFDLGISIFVPRAIQAKKNKDPNFQPTYYIMFSVIFLLAVYLIAFLLLMTIFEAPKELGFEEVSLLSISLFLIVTNKFIRLVTYSLDSYLIPSLTTAIIVVVRLLMIALVSKVSPITLTMIFWVFFATALVQTVVASLHIISITKASESRKRLEQPNAKIQLVEYSRNLGAAWKLTLASGAGAIAMQLDKVVIAIAYGVIAAAPVYYANSLSMVGLSLLALPLYQYFQPIITRSFLASDKAMIKSNLLRFSTSILLISGIFFLMMFFSSELIVQLWLGQQEAGDNTEVLLQFILPGGFFAMISIVPYSVLIAKEDYLFLALASSFLTAFFISSLWLVSATRPIIYCCYIISTYHILSCLLLIGRSLTFVHMPRQLKKVAFNE